ncbi:MAG: hypothetical protein LBL67_04450 [Coriobacteriales bacterium]|jgi:hypothetical protein|nr:hypothetical protein [Coriobacteriales bacterium]
MGNFDRESLKNTLAALDEEVSLRFGNDGKRLQMVIVGGSAFVLSGLNLRVTHDIDALSASQALSGLMEKYGINMQVAAYADSFPYNYEDRLVKLPISGQKIDFFAPSLEDLVVSKLYALRPPDIADLTSDEVLARLDWAKLERLVYGKDEAAASALSERRYQEMVRAFRDYEGRYRR